MKMTIERLKRNIIEIIMQRDCTIDDALTHPDIGEDLCRVAYANAGHDFDSCDWEMDDDELIERTDKISATVTEMLKAEGWE